MHPMRDLSALRYVTVVLRNEWKGTQFWLFQSVLLNLKTSHQLASVTLNLATVALDSTLIFDPGTVSCTTDRILPSCSTNSVPLKPYWEAFHSLYRLSHLLSSAPVRRAKANLHMSILNKLLVIRFRKVEQHYCGTICN